MFDVLAQTTQASTGITTTDIAAWTSLGLVIITAIGTLATAFIAMAARVYGQANSVRIDAQHQRLESQQTQISNGLLATPSPQSIQPVAQVKPTSQLIPQFSTHPIMATTWTPIITPEKK